jgi:hypothetical protein
VEVAAARHLPDQPLVAREQRGELPLPAARFGMPPVPALVEREDVPEPVQLAVLAEQVARAQQPRVQIPDPHPERQAIGIR